MSSRVRKNEAFLRNIYAKGPFQGHGFVCVPSQLGICEIPDYDFTLSEKPVSHWVPWMVENYRRLAEFVETVGDDSVPTARLSTGTHIFAAAFGCAVHRYPDNNPCAVPFVKTVDEADRLPVPELWKSPGLVRIFELARLVRNELGKDAFLGPPDMQSGFDTACLIWNKEDMLCAMMDDADKEAVKRLADKCARFYKTFLLEFRKEFPNCSPCHCPLVWSPPELGPWLSNDECGAFNTALFEEFCLPELLDLSKTFGGLGMHCCADAEHQFESFNKIPNFYGFNRVASKRGYRPILDHFAGPSAPVHVLGWIPEADITDLVKRAPEGMRFIFQFDAATPDEAKAWLARMRTLSPRRDGG